MGLGKWRWGLLLVGLSRLLLSVNRCGFRNQFLLSTFLFRFLWVVLCVSHFWLLNLSHFWLLNTRFLWLFQWFFGFLWLDIRCDLFQILCSLYFQLSHFLTRISFNLIFLTKLDLSHLLWLCLLKLFWLVLVLIVGHNIFMKKLFKHCSDYQVLWWFLRPLIWIHLLHFLLDLSCSFDSLLGFLGYFLQVLVNWLFIIRFLDLFYRLSIRVWTFFGS